MTRDRRKRSAVNFISWESSWPILDGIDAVPGGGCELLERTTVWGYVDNDHVAVND